ncbi:dehydrodolichyl diphosphate synthase complex subunit NUS1 isoform X1 [Vitis riparia]|uniref:dehydrodolichyl diphosphate synthase complex subunit NUS1 isoform X1 n=1 Tax=Vitis riparia TaxID=96939 RepID=UPI00155AA8B8|nr:dehydrodolichyl diphosphate synthase complex subunit NUS1 isoform X1 [Vitis riparia]XP_034678213.1 dehydrodolichyl diphosphate synthase complex subunit NUS1 isoform X1 [Vitis riparia]XP_034678219.1 dehydrodolichyl diphosphate synthase complex subunit NUS1 isoform X1 [Vitis riparia]
MDFGDEVQKVYCWISHIGSLGLKVLWHFLHFIVSVWFLARQAAYVLESCFISSGLLKRYEALNLGNLRYLAIVIESEEAHQIPKVIELLNWLATIGVKHVCLYDNEGVLKKSKEAILEKLTDATLFEGVDENNLLLDQEHITLEFASISDGKGAVTKAANLLFMKYLKSADSGGSSEESIFTEPHMAEALKAVGCRGPDPDLLLIYGPVRCHLGFPAWRIRYTEIIHMGPLKSMKYGSLLKAIYKFSMVHQNYGT